MRIKINLLTCLVLFSLTGCYTNKPVKTSSLEIKKEENKKINLKIEPIPVMPPTLKELTSIESEKPISSTLITLSFDGVDLSQALLTIAKATGFNVVIPPDVKGKVSIELKNEALDNSLKALLSPYGYSYKIDGNTIFIISKVTKVFHIKTPPGQRQFESSVESTIGGSSESESGTGAVSGSATMSVKNNYSYEFWANIENIIRSIIQNDKSASYSLEPVTGTLVVTGKPQTVEKVGRFIAKINNLSQRQVLIEAKIVEVKLNSKHKFGIDWKYLLSGTNDPDKYFHVINPYSSQSNTVELKVMKFKNTLNVILQALSIFGEVKILSSPRIMAINNQPAIIKVGKDYLAIYQSQATSTTSTGGQVVSTISTEGITTETILTEGITLTILPKIEDDKTVILNITPAVSSLDEPIVSSSVTGRFANRIYSINVRQLNTVVKVRSGETVVLGGLITERKSSETQGVPLLQDIPLFGKAFKSKSDISQKVELVIMLTPKVEIGNETD